MFSAISRSSKPSRKQRRRRCSSAGSGPGVGVLASQCSCSRHLDVECTPTTGGAPNERRGGTQLDGYKREVRGHARARAIRRRAHTKNAKAPRGASSERDTGFAPSLYESERRGRAFESAQPDEYREDRSPCRWRVAPKGHEQRSGTRDSNPLDTSSAAAERSSPAVERVTEEPPSTRSDVPRRDGDRRGDHDDPVIAALASALSKAAEAGRFDVVAQLARELEARRLAHAGNVVALPRRGEGTRRR